MIMHHINAPIGFIDSGIGGFSILNTIAHALPNRNIIYIADAAHLPYGNKSHDFLLQRGIALTKFLKSKQVMTIYIACHTLSSTILWQLQKLFPEIRYVDCLPPTITKALAQSVTKKIGIMATEATIKSGMHQTLLLSNNVNCSVTSQACPLFVPLIEQQSTEEECVDAINLYLQPCIKNNVDTIILGCTHYWFIEDFLKKQAPNITFISAANALAANSDNNNKNISIFTTATDAYLEKSVSFYFFHSTCCSITLESMHI